VKRLGLGCNHCLPLYGQKDDLAPSETTKEQARSYVVIIKRLSFCQSVKVIRNTQEHERRNAALRRHRISVKVIIKQLSIGILVGALVSSGARAQSYSVGQTVSAANSPTNVYPDDTGSSNPLIGTDAYGNQGHVLAAARPGGPGTGWIYDIAFDDDLTGWVYQGAISAVDARAPKVTLSTGGDIISQPHPRRSCGRRQAAPRAPAQRAIRPFRRLATRPR
jgi:hypothetical protein